MTLTTNLTTNYVVDALDGDDTITIEETANNVEIQVGKEDLVATAGDISVQQDQRWRVQTHSTSKGIFPTLPSMAKAGDSIVVTRAVSSKISGDTGKDTITLNGKINSSSIIDGGADDDLITLNERSLHQLS